MRRMLPLQWESQSWPQHMASKCIKRPNNFMDHCSKQIECIFRARVELSGPHSLVHGDLRLTSLLLSAQTDAKCAPQLVLADLGLAGLPPAPPPLGGKGEKMSPDSPDWSQCPSPLLDVWSCGCLIFMLLSGRHPFNGDPGGRLLPAATSLVYILYCDLRICCQRRSAKQSNRCYMIQAIF